MSINRPLTDRQRQAVALVAAGHSVKSGAQEMAVSTHTFKDHLNFARMKLGARTNAQAAVMLERARASV